MSRANNKRRRRNTSRREQNFSELQEVRVLLEILVKDTVEKEVHWSKQQLEEEVKRFLQIAAAMRNIAEYEGADTYIIEMYTLSQRVDSKVEKLHEKIDKLKSLPEAMKSDKHLIIGEHASISKEAKKLSEEIETFFTQVYAEIVDIISKHLQSVIEQDKQTLEDFITELFTDSISHLKSWAEQVNADKQLVKDIDNFQENIIRSHRDLLAEMAELKHLAEEGKAIDAIFHEYIEIKTKYKSLHEKIRDELKRISAKIKLLSENQTHRRRVSAFTKVFIIYLLVYLQWTVPAGFILLQWNSLIAFIITGLILISVHIAITSKLVTFYENFSPIFKITQFYLLNRFIIFTTMIMVLLSLTLLIYIVALHYLYLFLFYLLGFLTETNPLLSWITNVSAIATIIVLLISLLKRLDVLKYKKNLIPWTSRH